MDKPTTPGGSNPSPWPEESGSDQSFGATGVFRVVETTAPPAGSAPEPWLQELRAQEPPKPLPPPKPLAEPVVHKVVLGTGAENSPELLDRMRLASAERASVAEPPPAPASSGAGAGGFTALLRTLEEDSAAPAPAAPPAPAPRPPAQESGFTSLLRTLNSPDEAPAPAAPPAAIPASTSPFSQSATSQPAEKLDSGSVLYQGTTSVVPQTPKYESRALAPEATASGTPPAAPPPAPPAPGGFTQLLQTTLGADTLSSAPPMQRPADAPFYPAAAAPPENKPGAFTQLFGTFDSGEASAPIPPAADRATPDSSRASASSFTRMLSLEPQAPSASPAFREERKPLPGSVNYGATPSSGSPAALSQDPFAPPPLAPAKPAESNPPGGSVGITRLIQMLDEPVKPSPRIEPAPFSPPRAQEPGAWTQTFASLSASNEPAPPAPKAPAWTPPPVPPPVQAAPPAASFSQPPIQPSGSSGPSEFTRILDASRMRELAMRGGSGAASLPPAPQAPAAPPPPAIPSYQPPAAPPMPAPPPPPAPKPPEPGAGKMPMLVPILLIVIIVLLVVLLLVFLLKH